MKQINKNIFILLLTYFPAFVFGQVTKTYQLGEILQMGLKESHQLKLSVSQRKSEHLSVNEAKLGYAPNLSVSGQAVLMNQPRIEFKGNKMGAMNPKSAAFIMGNLTIPVFNGFQLRNNLRVAKELELSGMEKAELDSTQTVINIINAYVSLYKADKALHLIQENLKNAQKRVSDFEKLKENGLLSENDFLKAQLQVSQIELSLLDIENKRKIAQFNLNLLTGIEENTTFSVDSTIFYQAHLINENYSIEEVKSNRSDYQSLIHQQQASKYAAKLSKNIYYPHINLTAAYLNMNAPNTFSVYNMLNAGISLSYNLSDLYKKAPKIAQAKQKYLQIQERSKILSNQIKMQLNSAYLDYRKANEKLKVYKKTVQQASENYANMQSKHANNLATTTDLLDADLTLLQAQINQQMARADLFLTYCNYLKVTGKLDQLKAIE